MFRVTASVIVIVLVIDIFYQMQVCLCFRMLAYQQQIASLEGDCRDLRSYLQVRISSKYKT